MEELEIKSDAVVTPKEVEKLRQTVGWDKLEGKQEMALKNTYKYFSIRKDNKLIAFARVISDGTIHAFIVDLMVDPDYQHHSLGKKMVQHIIDELRKENIPFIQLTFDQNLEQFYKDCGFEIIQAGILINK